MPQYIKQLAYDDDARKRIKSGVDKAVNAIKITLGPRGQNVLMENAGAMYPTSTKDGVTVARSINLSDKFENMGVDLIKEIASKTESSAGDGTTTTAILAQALLNSGINSIEAGTNPIEIRRGINKAIEIVDKFIIDSSKEATQEEIERVAIISANDERVGKIVADVFNTVGKDGVVTVEASQGMDIETEVVKGLQLDKGFVSPYFVTDSERGKFKGEGINVFITDQHLTSQSDVIPIMETLREAGREKNGTLIIAEEIAQEALGVLVVNKLRGAFPCVAVKSPSFGDLRAQILKDVAVITGAKIVSKEVGKDLDKIEIEDIGIAESVTITKDKTIIVGDSSLKDSINAHVANLETELSKMNAKFEIEMHRGRIAKLTSGVAAIRVGAATESEMKELQYRIEDAVEASRSASEEGIVIGGGMALYWSRTSLEDIKNEPGVDIVYSALTRPLKTLIENAGYNERGVLERLLISSSASDGFNAETGQVENLMTAGIVDATKVVRMAIKNAASIVGLILVTGAIIAIEEPETHNETQI